MPQRGPSEAQRIGDGADKDGSGGIKRSEQLIVLNGSGHTGILLIKG
ncbi:MAG: hypothetical protein IPK52_20815 [Chloroflexi bacterium]|nr:hypothetical protein [Chloroflexota bacterium]